MSSDAIERLRRHGVSEAILARSIDETIDALARLTQYRVKKRQLPGAIWADSIPAYRNAAVMLPLIVSPDGLLHVVLTQRSDALRSHGGDTALPGGRYEFSDTSLERTARREASEELGLPDHPFRVLTLCELQPFMSANELAVTPYVMLLQDELLRLSPNPQEVQQVFTIPLAAFLFDSPPPWLRTHLHVDQLGTHPESGFEPPRNDPEEWHTAYDVIWLSNYRYRRHTFWDARSPVRGLTRCAPAAARERSTDLGSDILIHAASSAYRRRPQFKLNAPLQPRPVDMLYFAFASVQRTDARSVMPRMRLPRTMHDVTAVDAQITQRMVAASELDPRTALEQIARAKL